MISSRWPHSALALVALGALVPVPAFAGLFDGFFRNEAACEATDRDCVMQLYLETVTKRAQVESTGPYYAGRDFADHSINWSDAERDAAFAHFRAADVDEEFFERATEQSALITARDSLNAQGIAASMNNEGWPEVMQWNDFISDAVNETLFNSQEAEVLFDLWRGDQGFFEEYAEKQSVQIMQWGLINRTQDTLDYLNSDAADQKVAKRGLDSFVEAAAEMCRKDAKDQSASVIEGFRQFSSTQKYTGSSEFLPLKNDFMIALACDDRAVANTAFDALEAVVNQKLEEMGPSFEAGWVYSGLKDASEQYALTLVDEGDEARARDILKRGTSRTMTMGSVQQGEKFVDITVWDVEVEGKWPEYKHMVAEVVNIALDDLVDLNSGDAAYSFSLDERLEYYTDTFDPQFKICCVEEQTLEYMLETIEEAANTRDISELSAKLMTLIDRNETVEEEPYSARTLSEMRLAKVEKAKGCSHSDATAQAMLVSVSTDDVLQYRAAGLAAFLDYMSVAPTGAGQECLFE